MLDQFHLHNNSFPPSACDTEPAAKSGHAVAWHCLRLNECRIHKFLVSRAMILFSTFQQKTDAHSGALHVGGPWSYYRVSIVTMGLLPKALSGVTRESLCGLLRVHPDQVPFKQILTNPRVLHFIPAMGLSNIVSPYGSWTFQPGAQTLALKS